MRPVRQTRCVAENHAGRDLAQARIGDHVCGACPEGSLLVHIAALQIVHERTVECEPPAAHQLQHARGKDRLAKRGGFKDSIR